MTLREIMEKHGLPVQEIREGCFRSAFMSPDVAYEFICDIRIGGKSARLYVSESAPTTIVMQIWGERHTRAIVKIYCSNTNQSKAAFDEFMSIIDPRRDYQMELAL